MAGWQEKVKVALDRRDASLRKIQPELGALSEQLPLSSQQLAKEHLTEREIELTEKYDAVELLQLLGEKKLTSEELTKAFLRRAALAQYAASSTEGHQHSLL